MRTGVTIGILGSLAGVLFAAPQEAPVVAGGPPAPTAQVVALEWRFADGSRLAYEGRDAVAAGAWLAAAEGLARAHGAPASGGLAGVRWTTTAADGRVTRGAWPGAFDARLLSDAGVPPAQSGPGIGHPLDAQALAKVFPGWQFQAVDIARGAAGVAPDRLVIAAPPVPEGAPGTLPAPAVLLDGLDAVLAFLRAHATAPAVGGGAAEHSRAFATLCRYDSWEGPLTGGRDGGIVAALAVGLPGQRTQAGQLTLEWTAADGWRVLDPRPPEVNGK